MKHYDILFCMASYKSNESAIRMIKSLPLVGGRCGVCCMTPIQEDAKALAEEFCDEENVYIFESQRNSMAFARGWGFAWGCAKSVTADFYCGCDDDLEFTENSSGMMPLLRSTEWPWVAMAFNSTHPYKYGKDGVTNGTLRMNLPWLDENCVFVRWSDVEKFGVMDGCNLVGSPFFCGAEYSHRLRCLSGRPIVFYEDKEYYKHHFRSDPKVNAERAGMSNLRTQAGNWLWKIKFGISVNFRKGMDHEKLYEAEAAFPERFKSHVIFSGLWTEWDTIYRYYSCMTRLVEPK